MWLYVVCPGCMGYTGKRCLAFFVDCPANILGKLYL